MNVVAEQSLPRIHYFIESADQSDLYQSNVLGGNPAMIMGKRHGSILVQHEPGQITPAALADMHVDAMLPDPGC
ncbi:hypothetical protein JS533_009310 [Bifidobacterium amazonense]|uniref:Uncharacterized protein n=1 Tax=Bifidobacterium amazonense TaxID=2809027 RepID=A0ABS9VWH6_9BIFI|nr:hypothetical protein [Bifidobacterium amazonense]MCH9276460.1 hypothetical protein [Bifidobacterium amazonense]